MSEDFGRLQVQKNELAANAYTTIGGRVRALITQHGGLRKAARALQIDKTYLSRLGTGEKTNPSDAMLKRLGLRKITVFVEKGTSLKPPGLARERENADMAMASQ